MKANRGHVGFRSKECSRIKDQNQGPKSQIILLTILWSFGCSRYQSIESLKKQNYCQGVANKTSHLLYKLFSIQEFFTNGKKNQLFKFKFWCRMIIAGYLLNLDLILGKVLSLKMKKIEFERIGYTQIQQIASRIEKRRKYCPKNYFMPYQMQEDQLQVRTQFLNLLQLICSCRCLCIILTHSGSCMSRHSSYVDKFQVTGQYIYLE